MISKHACLILLSNCIPFVFLFNYEKPVSQKLWRQRCVRNSLVLNDCNWCWCSQNFRYTCNARVCENVDMFGHFNDAIQDIDVGMEGHGVWRSKAYACEPGVHYTRRDLLCVCTEEGTWPNPVCRDIFRVLHPVEVVQNFELSENQKCNPTKLYLADCNVCFCPSTGRIDPSLCTQEKCSTSKLISLSSRSDHKEVNEVYAECNVNENYQLGCKNCICLRNNRLVCNNCTEESKCAGRQPGENFLVDCNTCHCDAKGTIYCTYNRCLNSQEEIEIMKHTQLRTPIARRPYEDIDCEPGTRFKKDCNTCYCFLMKGNIKKYGCTLKKCHVGDKAPVCVMGATYSKECQLCHCNIFNDHVMEICQTDPQCLKNRHTLRIGEYVTQECEPNHVYTNDCNTCECSPDGKKIKCTDNSCEEKPISLSIIPVVQKLPDCPKGHSYKIDCNFCFCLDNGNAMCTTKNCKSLNK